MSHLKSLTFCLNPQLTTSDPRIVRRQRLIERLEEQKNLSRDPDYSVVIRRVAKDQSGNRTVMEKNRRIRPWWRIDENGMVVLTVRSGFKILELEKGKSGVVVGTIDKMEGVIDTLIQAIRVGELDHLLNDQKQNRTVSTKKAA